MEPLPDYMVKEILFYSTPDLWHKRMTEQGYNYIDDAMTLHHMADFFETRCENLEVKPTGKKSSKDSKKPSKKHKAVQFATSDEESSEDEKPKKTNKLYCLHHRRCGHTSERCSVLKDLVKQSKKKKAKFNKPNKTSPRMR